MILSYMFAESIVIFLFLIMLVFLGVKYRNKIKRIYLLPFLIFLALMIGKIILNIQGVTYGIYFNIGKILLFLDVILLISLGGENER